MQNQNAPFSLNKDELFETLATGEAGLSEESVTKRLQEFGLNVLPSAPPTPAWKRFVSQFKNVLIYVLIVSGLISGLLGHFVDSGVILAVVLVNAIVGYIQEGKAEDALRAIMSMARSQCLTVRQGVIETIDSSQLVPGDVVMLQAGDRVPADMRLFYCKDLRCDESSLTGEAHPISKHIDVLDESVPLAERGNMAFMGSLVTYGVARGVVTHTGVSTQIGKISEMVGGVVSLDTPLQNKLTRFAHQLTIAIVILSLLTAVFGILLHNYSITEMFQAAIGIAVASVPEGVPAVVTIALAIGVQRMARNKALVRRLPAVEVLGAVDIICSDKTGTLTENAMTAREVFTSFGGYRVRGEGYKPEGDIEHLESAQGVMSEGNALFVRVCEVAALCNDARIEQDKDDWILHGDPTEGALMVLALKYGIDLDVLNGSAPRIDLVPFESEKRYMATLHRSQNDKVCLHVKGAPERLLNFAGSQLGEQGEEPLDKLAWQQKMDEFAERGMRVMALATKTFSERPKVLTDLDVESDLMLLALVGITDPPRPEAVESIKQCHAAGVRVKMITGDNPVTAAAIGRELGLSVERVLTGQDIDAFNEDQLAEAVEKTDVFARTSPANKLQLVNALQKNNHVVAMTGDGVNDAPALKQANIGVAMGYKGTDAAKEAADFVLTDDNFSTIAKAIKEGRTVYDNILKSIIFILPTSLAEALVIFVAIMLGSIMPITPAQILWINMVTAITLALALAFERAERDVMCRPPRQSDQGLFSLSIVVRLLMVGGLGAGIVFSLFHWYLQGGATIEYARTVAVNALVMIEVFYLFNCRLLTQTIFSYEFTRGSGPMVLASASVLLLQLLFTYLPISQELFGLSSLLMIDWLVIILMAVPVLLIVELEKMLLKRVVPSKASSSFV